MLVLNAKIVVLEAPLRVAVRVTVAFSELLLMAVKEALEDPAETVTDCGTVTAVLLLLNGTVVAAVAAALSATVQLLDDAPDSEVGVHDSELNVAAGGATVSVAVLELPASVAVKVTEALTAPLLVAEKGALEDPTATVTDCGMTTAVLLLLNVTAVATVTAPLKVTVQALEDAPESAVGLQPMEINVGAAALTVGAALTVTAPPVPESETAPPTTDAATIFTTLSVDVCEAITFTVATTPSAIAVAFIPYAIHV